MATLLTTVFITIFLRDSLAINNSSEHVVVSSSDSRPDFCIREATIRQAVLVGGFKTGSCALWSPSSHLSSHPPLFMMLEISNKVLLLLKTLQRRQQNTFKLLFFGQSNCTQPDQRSLKDSDDQFRSPLINLDPSPFSHVHVILRDQNGAVVVNLTFSMQANARVSDEDAWFNKNQLVDAFPWPVNVLKSKRVYQFNAKRTNQKEGYFVIRGKMGTFCRQSGYLVVTAKKLCRWQSHRIMYIWSNESNETEFGHGQRAAEFNVYGTLNPMMSRWYLHFQYEI